MSALLFHPSKVLEIDVSYEKAADILREVEIEAESIFANQSVQFSLTEKVNDGVKADQGKMSELRLK